MPRFLVRRALGPATMAEIIPVADAATEVRLDKFPKVEWEHTHVAHDADGGLTGFCVYSAPDAQSIRDYSTATNLPVDEILEIEADLTP